MKRSLPIILTLIVVSLAFSSCASSYRRRVLIEPSLDAVATDAIGHVKRALGYTDPSDILARMESGDATGFSFDFADSVDSVLSAARQTLIDYGLETVYDIVHDDQNILVSKIGPNRDGLGELIGISVEAGSGAGSHVLIVSQRQFKVVLLEKDWASDILAGIKARLEIPETPAQTAAVVEKQPPAETGTRPFLPHVVWL